MSKEHFDIGSGDGANIALPAQQREWPAPKPGEAVKQAKGGRRVSQPAEPPVNDALTSYRKITGKKAVGLQDAINMTAVFHQNLRNMHTEVSSRTRGILPRGMKPAREHLEAAAAALQTARHLANSATSTAWNSLQEAGTHVRKAHQHLIGIHPEAADLSVHHPINGTPVQLVPGDLKEITTNPSPMAPAKPPKKVAVTLPAQKVNTETGEPIPRKRVVKTAKVKKTIAIQEGLKEAGASTDVTRREVKQAITEKMKPTPKRRFPTPVEEYDVSDPKKPSTPVEPLGAAATDVGRTGDWSGAATPQPMPGASPEAVQEQHPQPSAQQAQVVQSRQKEAEQEGDIARKKIKQMGAGERFKSSRIEEFRNRGNK